MENKGEQISGEQIQEYPDNPYLRLNKVQPGDTAGEIFANLADVTNPQSIESVLMDEKRGQTERMSERDISLERERVFGSQPQTLSPERRDELTRHMTDFSRQRRDLYENSMKRRVDEELAELKNSSTLISLRDEAAELYKRYTQNNMQLSDSAESYFARESTRIWQEMHDYVREYLEYGDGRLRINPFSSDLDQVIQTIKQDVMRSIQVQADVKRSGRDSGYGAFMYATLPEDQRSWWDKEEIALTATRDGKINALRFNEHFSYTTFCTSPEELLKAYQVGVELTPYQKVILRREGFDVPLRGDEEEVVEDFDTNLLDVFTTMPAIAFPAMLPKEILEKLAGKSHGYFYATQSKDFGSIKVNLRNHDYGEDQLVIDLDLKELGSDESDEVLKTYLKTLRAFPRIKKIK